MFNKFFVNFNTTGVYRITFKVKKFKNRKRYSNMAFTSNENLRPKEG